MRCRFAGTTILRIYSYLHDNSKSRRAGGGSAPIFILLFLREHAGRGNLGALPRAGRVGEMTEVIFARVR